ncbi:hypothetical protein [Brevundimonas pishanensis]|uniref:hypothetical protein n=1 Tax=Brevundimonas pishanensis TaxID=2896315 RepID=UPI001FA7E324|nr:hypothetical protein [Brevundimonas pishanensis]
MKSNLDRYRADLDSLIELGNQLSYAMHRKVIGEDVFDAQVRDQLGGEEAEKFLKNYLASRLNTNLGILRAKHS